jgi:glycosyltransferase involved in cell wall biosynthesis
MDNGGVETWLMHVLRGADRRRVRMDFLVHTSDPSAYDAEIRERESQILRCTAPLHSPGYAWRIREVLDKHGPFDAIHSHVHYFSGYLLGLSKLCGVPTRIAHSHSDTSVADRRTGWPRRGYLQLMRTWIWRHATNLLGASFPAGESLFGRNWIHDPRSKVLYCGVDFGQFPRGHARAAARSAIRSAWKIAPHELVIGHVGRFAPPKNHEFLIQSAARVMRRNAATRLLLVGDGPSRASMVELAEELGIARQVIFAGVQQHVPHFLAAMDVFVFPSRYEGLGLALLEAQAAGLPCVVSDSVPEEAGVVPDLLHRVPLARDCEEWAAVILSAARGVKPAAAESLGALERSEFQIGRSLEALYSVYAA